MPRIAKRKQRPSLNDLCHKHKVDPVEYLIKRLAAHIASEQHVEATTIALKLLPYAAHPKGAEPAPAVEKAMEQNRLVIMAAPAIDADN